jgi:hypothetical protein
MADDRTAVFDTPVDQVPDPDELVRATMAWHFSPETGSPYWTGRAGELGFDPIADVKSLADLRLFDDVAVDWARIPADRLIPRGAAGGERFGVYESGGATGAPKRVVDASSRRRNVEYQSLLLDRVGFPRGGGWLHIGPTGPHVMGKNVTTLTGLRGFLCHYVDLDPRWVRRCVSQGRTDLFDLYLEHLTDQVKDVLDSQDIRAVSCTPRILERLVTRPDVYELLRAKVRGVIWGGTSASPETLRLFGEELLPEAVIQGAYGNTMMGVAPQRPPVSGDAFRCVFRPFYPYTLIDVVDPGDPRRVLGAGETGRVRITTLTRDLFVPPTPERDTATRLVAADGYPGIELGGVRPTEAAASTVVEGVY